MRITTPVCWFWLVCTLVGCSAPPSSPDAYPQNEQVSSPQGVPHDSATSYFPARASINTSSDSIIRKLGDCQFEFCGASRYLFGFKAPVLSNYYLGHSIYRFLWTPAFRLPVLLTLDLSETNGVLKTQLLNRPPFPTSSPAETGAESQPVIQRIKELNSLIQAGKDVPDNTERLASAQDRLDGIKLSGTPLTIKNEKAVILSSSQIQQFQELLEEAKFWQLPSCEPTRYFDGADYVLEVQEAHHYKVVRRQSPKETDPFFQCCMFLLNLSPAKPEARSAGSSANF